MKRMIDPLEHATEILQGVQKGVLLTTKHGDRVNSMTISWGTLGIEWGKPLFTAFVRQHRFTKEFLEATGEFSVNIPVGEFDKNIIVQDQDLRSLDPGDIERWYPTDETGFRDFHTVFCGEIVAAYVIE